MKVILTGATGFIGHEALQQCISNPRITQIVTLTRRPLEIKNPKLTSIIIPDFLSYEDEVLKELKEADAWIWALGKAWMPDESTARTVHVGFPLTAARALTSNQAAVRFILLSGGAAERDQQKFLLFSGTYRKIRGQAENEILNFSGKVRVHVIRPGMVLKKEWNLRDAVRGMLPSVRVDVLARAMVEVAVRGGKEVWENADIRAV